MHQINVYCFKIVLHNYLLYIIVNIVDEILFNPINFMHFIKSTFSY